MGYTTQKAFLAVVTSIFIVIGCMLLLGSALKGVADIQTIIGGAFAGLGSYNLLTSWRRITHYQTQTYNWYREQNPSHVHGNGISCKGCGGRHIHARGLMQHSYTRVHYCTQCGTNLYYSPE